VSELPVLYQIRPEVSLNKINQGQLKNAFSSAFPLDSIPELTGEAIEKQQKFRRKE
jgi:hypothetical protein